MDPSTLDCLNAVAQGDGEQNRDGKQIKMTKISIKGHIRINAQADQTSTDMASSFFVALVLDTQTNGAQLNSEDVFTNISGDASNATLCFRNLQYSKRFVILRSEVIRAEQPTIVWDGTNIEQGGYQIPFEWHVDLNHVCNYKGTTSVVTNIVDNSLHMIAYDDTSSNPPAVLSYNARLRFYG